MSSRDCQASPTRPALGMLAVALAVALACGSGPPSDAVRRGVYAARGEVVEVQPEYGQVVVAHEDIPGLMPAMTMNFDVPDRELLETLVPGHRIEFQLEVTGASYRIVDAISIGVGQSRAARLGIAGAVREEEPAPAFTLVDQDGATLSLADLRGKTLLLDFIYTNCPGPCPALTSIHTLVQKGVAPELRERVHFVSISLDPARDDPEAMRSYASARGADLGNWSFLTGDVSVVDDVLERYGVGRVPGSDGQIDHLIVTFLIDSEGGIVKRYIGLEHAAEEKARDLTRLASAELPPGDARVGSPAGSEAEPGDR